MQRPFFSIVVVSLNPGERLKKTLDSILKQTFTDYEVIIKDGGSSDGSLSGLQEAGYFEDKNQIKIQQKKDRSIYDGMNQAVSYANGKFVQFLNCGDYFYSPTVLEEVARFIEEKRRANLTLDGIGEQKEEVKNTILSSDEMPVKIFYGNQYNQVQDTIISSAPHINDFTCYRNVPCHQVCFYDYRLFEKRAYDLQYQVRADYEHFLYSIYEEQAEGISMPIIIASYEGGGFSETKENRKKSAMEHRQITKKYLGTTKSLKYRGIMWLTLAPLRTRIAENPALSGIYNGFKNRIYQLLGR
ncbi:MAG: glycosyltransferase [Lachnospiraceae bacterium]|nr:glycosyltransferase [Lachnospiraceae bacterium]